MEGVSTVEMGSMLLLCSEMTNYLFITDNAKVIENQVVIPSSVLSCILWWLSCGCILVKN